MWEKWSMMASNVRWDNPHSCSYFLLSETGQYSFPTWKCKQLGGIIPSHINDHDDYCSEKALPLHLNKKINTSDPLHLSWTLK
jgi:hypothetical protein